jgi:hypothetical protein
VVSQEQKMNWHDVEVNWNEIRKKVKSNWKNLSEEEIDATQGKPAQLSALIQKEYKVSDREADQQMEEWLSNLLGSTVNPLVKDPDLQRKLEENLDTPETIEKRDDVVGSPFHRTI